MANRSKWTKDEWKALERKVKQCFRKAKRLSHAKIGAACGCSAQTVRNIRDGFVPVYFKE